jgi:hypothetical protein
MLTTSASGCIFRSPSVAKVLRGAADKCVRQTRGVTHYVNQLNFQPVTGIDSERVSDCQHGEQLIGRRQCDHPVAGKHAVVHSGGTCGAGTGLDRKSGVGKYWWLCRRIFRRVVEPQLCVPTIAEQFERQRVLHRVDFGNPILPQQRSPRSAKQQHQFELRQHAGQHRQYDGVMAALTAEQPVTRQ